MSERTPAPVLHTDRRGAMKAAAGIGLGAAIPGQLSAQAPRPVVETRDGKLRGSASTGAHVFKGIPYGASTAGANRYLPPQPVTPWTGVRDALAWGDTAPQTDGSTVDPNRVPQPGDPKVSEDCLVLNVFTPEASRAKKRPVMVWLHGGGWWVGSGSEAMTEGSNLAEFGDVVVVTLNHRLNIFGYLKLEDDDPRFADAGNVGVLDMVAALKWVQGNIAAFGGDPANVTIFGYSGGGAKVSALMGAPVARGLFHKAIAQSCGGPLMVTRPDRAAALTRSIGKFLGLDKVTGEAMQKVPVERLQQAMKATTTRIGPVLDGRTFTRHPYDPDAAPAARAIPLMAGNMATETTVLTTADPKNLALGLGEVQRRMAAWLKIDAGQAARILRTYRGAYPASSPSDLMTQVTTDYMFIRDTKRVAELQAAAGKAPVYYYIFNWRAPGRGGIMKSPHGMDVFFMFGNTDVAKNLVGTGPQIDLLRRTMMTWVVNFARHGNPNGKGVPSWPPFDNRAQRTMLIDVPSRAVPNPFGKARAALDNLPLYEFYQGPTFTRP